VLHCPFGQCSYPDKDKHINAQNLIVKSLSAKSQFSLTSKPKIAEPFYNSNSFLVLRTVPMDDRLIRIISIFENTLIEVGIHC
tara:strand:+ start:106 stop:354 length:249 start_codon:yes stop_codon:yes gene_type:complete